MEGLEALRREIDAIDSMILDLLRRRMEVCRKIKLYKIHNGLPLRDEAREAEVLSRAEPFTNIFQEIIRSCREVEAAV
ncbi:MAG: chorismate mutase [Desulfurococcales archaeon]|nr:chorismate mutase [Desulfurococcales archaeon]